MEYRQLGNTELSVSAIAFGCWAIGGHGYGKVDDAVSIKAIHRALDIGINLFDTADVYGFGHSEEVLGKALGSKRNQVVIATKFGVSWDEYGHTGKCCSRERARTAVEASLRRLGVDAISLYQVHWHDGITPIADILEELDELLRQGKIRHYGCSNFPRTLMERVVSDKRFESLQTLYNVLRQEERPTIDYCSTELGMGVLVYGVLARGLFSGKYSAGATFGENDTRAGDPDFSEEALSRASGVIEKLKAVGSRYGKSPAQVAIRWVLDTPGVTSAIVGIKDYEQVESNVGGIGWKLERADHAELSGMAKSSMT